MPIPKLWPRFRPRHTLHNILPKRWRIEGITSTASDFTVDAPNHTLEAGDTAQIEGASPVGYNGEWLVDSVVDDNITILDTANLGAGSGGTIKEASA